MIKIPYDELGKRHTQDTIQKLANSTFRTPKAWTIKFMTKAIRDGFFEMKEEYITGIEGKFAENKGAPPAEGSKSAELKLPFHCKQGLENAAKTALDEFGKRELKIERKKLDASLLFECNEWSPRELEVLEYFFDEPAETA